MLFITLIRTTLVLQILCLHSPSISVFHRPVSVSHSTLGFSSPLYMKSSSHVTSAVYDESGGDLHDVK